MEYKIDIYEYDDHIQCRYALGIRGKKPLVVIGLNPSTADHSNSDQTIRRVMGFAESNCYDGFIMFNLYPLKETDPSKLPVQINKSYHQTNLRVMQKVVRRHKVGDVMAVWGNNIIRRPYLCNCLSDIYATFQGLEVNWHQLGEPTKLGHPRHPLRLSVKTKVERFDVDKYVFRWKGTLKP